MKFYPYDIILIYVSNFTNQFKLFILFLLTINFILLNAKFFQLLIHDLLLFIPILIFKLKLNLDFQ